MQPTGMKVSVGLLCIYITYKSSMNIKYPKVGDILRLYNGRGSRLATVAEVRDKVDRAEIRCGDDLIVVHQSSIDEHHYLQDGRLIFSVTENQIIESDIKLIEVIGHESIEKAKSVAVSSENGVQ